LRARACGSESHGFEPKLGEIAIRDDPTLGRPLLRIGGQRCFASKRRVWKRNFMVGSMHRVWVMVNANHAHAADEGTGFKWRRGSERFTGLIRWPVLSPR